MQGVLGCLDVQLEEELTRFRRQRAKLATEKPQAPRDQRLAALDIVGFKPQRFRQSATAPLPILNPHPSYGPQDPEVDPFPSLSDWEAKVPQEDAIPQATSESVALYDADPWADTVLEVPNSEAVSSWDESGQSWEQNDRSLPLLEPLPVLHEDFSEDFIEDDRDDVSGPWDLGDRSPSQTQNQPTEVFYHVNSTHQLSPQSWDQPLTPSPLSPDGSQAEEPLAFVIETKAPALTMVDWTDAKTLAKAETPPPTPEPGIVGVTADPGEPSLDLRATPGDQTLELGDRVTADPGEPSLDLLGLPPELSADELQWLQGATGSPLRDHPDVLVTETALGDGNPDDRDENLDDDDLDDEQIENAFLLDLQAYGWSDEETVWPDTLDEEPGLSLDLFEEAEEETDVTGATGLPGDGDNRSSDSLTDMPRDDRPDDLGDDVSHPAGETISSHAPTPDPLPHEDDRSTIAPHLQLDPTPDLSLDPPDSLPTHPPASPGSPQPIPSGATPPLKSPASLVPVGSQAVRPLKALGSQHPESAGGSLAMAPLSTLANPTPSLLGNLDDEEESGDGWISGLNNFVFFKLKNVSGL